MINTRHTLSRRFLGILASLLLAFGGCQPVQDDETRLQRESLEKSIHEVRVALQSLKEIQSENADQTQKIIDLNERIAILEKTLKKYAQSQDTLVKKTDIIAKQMDQPQSVVLDDTQHDYQRLESERGFFLVKQRGVQAYMDGYKLFLEILNPNSISYTGTSVTLRWGRPFVPGTQDEPTWRRSLEQRDTRIPGVFQPGARKQIEIFLPRTVQEELKYKTLSISVENVKVPPRPSVSATPAATN